MSVRYSTVILLFVIGFLSGCETSTQSDAVEPASSSPQTSSEQTSSALPVQVVYANLNEIEQYRATLKGKVVVIDLWSTWCLSCLREFPNFVELQREFPKEVVCISVNLNYEGLPDEPPQTYGDEILEQLQKFDANLVNYICTDESEAVYKKLEFDSLPAVFLYDKEGNLVKRFDNSQLESPDDEFTYKKDVIPQVKALVDSK
ncbi:MAG: TlpA disulfide reductase family protein [Planctomycetaceae bacterium]